MPLTAYSASHSGEVDVEQMLNWASALFGQPYTAADAIPETWRDYLRNDLQCPSCFVKGAEVVRSATKAGRSSRQSFFRFTSPGHKPHCDFDSPETANSVPENLVSLTESKSNLTRAVRQLVCAGIEQSVFTQASIRDMREWFFNRKVESLFVVTIDPRLFSWMSEMQRAFHRATVALPRGVALTPEIAALPQFDWGSEAARQVVERYPQHRENMAAVMERVAMFGPPGERAESLAKRFQGRTVFDPTALAQEYRKTTSVANFIAHNYAPLKTVTRGAGTASVLAFSALLLFIRGWDVSLAVADFARIAASAGSANQSLGNVMGLNPFHDYEAWQILKTLQDLKIMVPENVDIKAERIAMEVALRQQYGAPRMPT